MELLIKYFENQLVDFDNVQTDELEEMKLKKKAPAPETSKKSSKEEKIKPKKNLKPIL